MSPNGRRLTEYLRACAVNRRRVTWSYVDSVLVCERLGWSDSTYRRALKEARKSEDRLIIRTLFVGAQGAKGKWRLMIALPCRLEPEQLLFQYDENGRGRHVYNALRGRKIELSSGGSDCHPLEDRATPEMVTTPPRRFGRSARPPTAMVRMGWALARRFAADVGCSKWLVADELSLPQCARAFAGGLRSGLCADSLFRAAMRQVELVHVHNTDAKFDTRGRLRRRGFGFVIREALATAGVYSPPLSAGLVSSGGSLPLDYFPGSALGCFARLAPSLCLPDDLPGESIDSTGAGLN